MKQLLPIIAIAILATLPLTAWTQVPPQSVILPGIDEDSMKARFSESDLQPLEGIWYYPSEDMTLAIEKWEGERNMGYRIILLASSDLELMPGTVMGFMASSAVDNKFKLWLYSERSHVDLKSPLECVATLSAHGTSLTFDPPHWKLKTRINLGQFLPSIFGRISITPEKEEEKLPIGFKKTFPANGNGNSFNEIRYL